MRVTRREAPGLYAASSILHGWWRRWYRDERGAELVQFAMLMPILVGLFLIIFEVRQLTTLRDDLRAATAQAARFVTAYVVPLQFDEQYAPKPVYRPTPQEIQTKAEQIVRGALANKRGILGDALAVKIDWYRIVDPLNPDWRDNSVLLGPTDPLAGLLSNDHFAMRVQVDVPWRTILLGLGAPTESRYNLTLVDTTVGAVPDQPFIEFDIATAVDASGGGDCQMQISWTIDASYLPRTLSIWLNGERELTIPDPVTDQRTIAIDPGGRVDVDVVIDEGTPYELVRHSSGNCPGRPTP